MSAGKGEFDVFEAGEGIARLEWWVWLALFCWAATEGRSDGMKKSVARIARGSSNRRAADGRRFAQIGREEKKDMRRDGK